MKLLIKALFVAGCVGLSAWCFKLYSAAQVSPLTLIKKVSDFNHIPAHQGVKTAHFYKNGKHFSARTEIKYLDTKHFLFKTHEPEKYKGNLIAADGENFLMYMPKFRARLKMQLRLDIRLEKGIETIHLNIDMAPLNKNYHVSYLGKQKVAGQETAVFQLKGKKIPFLQKIWVATEKPLILQAEKQYQGKKYYSFTYTDFSFAPPSPEEIAPKIPIAAFPLPSQSDLEFFDSLSDARQRLKNASIPILEKLPSGYAFSHVEVMKSPLGEVVSSLYSDGVSGIRVGKRKEGGVFDGMLKMFGLNMDEIQNDIKNYSPMNFYEIKKGNEFFALSGELPDTVLKKYMPYFSDAH